MRNPLVAPLLLLLVPAARAAPKAGGHRPEAHAATRLDPGPDPLSLELPTLPLLQSVVRSLGPPERDTEAMTREQVLLYLFVLYDHDRSGRLDGLELLQLLGTVLVQRDRGRPDPDTVAALVDRVLERQDLSRDGLLDPSELLLSPHLGQAPPGQPLLQQPGELPAGPAAGAVPGGEAEPSGGDMGMSSPGHGLAEGQAAPQAEAPDTEVMEVEKATEAGAIEAEEAPEIEAPETEAPEGDAAPVWEDPGEG